jgi:hypothetical protein
LTEKEVLYCEIPDGLNYNNIYLQYFNDKQASDLRDYFEMKLIDKKLKAYLRVYKQGSKNWYDKIIEVFKKLGYTQLLTDQCLFILWNENRKYILFALYVDDIFGTYNEENLVKNLFNSLSEEFSLTDLGSIGHCLGCNVTRNNETGDLILSNETYINNIINEFDMHNCKIALTPIPPNTYLSPYDSPEASNIDKELQSKYRSLIGSFMFAAIFWRPDIAQATAHLSRFLHIPGERHMNLAKHILRYLKGISHYGLLFKRDLMTNFNDINPLLIASCDANKSKESDGISTTGYCLQIVDRNSYLGLNDTKEIDLH